MITPETDSNFCHCWMISCQFRFITAFYGVLSHMLKKTVVGLDITVWFLPDSVSEHYKLS